MIKDFNFNTEFQKKLVTVSVLARFVIDFIYGRRLYAIPVSTKMQQLTTVSWGNFGQVG